MDEEDSRPTPRPLGGKKIYYPV